MQRVSLPGGWVEYRAPEEVPERLRRRVTTMSATISKISGSEDELTADDLEMMLEFNDAIALCLVTAWSWDFPVTDNGLRELPVGAYDAIVGHGRDNIASLMPNFGVDPDPKAPTEK